MNLWHNSVQELRPDGSTYTVFTNLIGEVLLTDLSDGTNHWVTYNQYGTDASDLWQLTLAAAPSAVDVGTVSETTGEHGYDSGDTDLNIQLFASAGLIDQYAYASTTTATDSSAGNVEDYLESEALLNGADATPVPIESYQYLAHAGNVAAGAGFQRRSRHLPTGVRNRL